LENNIVQTAASAGESIAAGVIFTIPALVIMGVWTEFDFLKVTLIAGLGGVVGVLFTIPLRRALIPGRRGLLFPEGVATAEVLQTGERGGSGAVMIALAGLAGAVYKFCQTGLNLLPDKYEIAGRIGLGRSPVELADAPAAMAPDKGTIAYFGSNLSPALMSVGYIVGINIASLICIGGVFNWLVAIPIYAATHGWPLDEGATMSAADWAGEIWSTRTRYLGVGAMVVGGLWALISLRKSISHGIRSGLAAARATGAAAGSGPAGAGGLPAIPRTERDTPMKWVLWALVISVVPIFMIYLSVVQGVAISLVMAVIMLVAGFLFSAVAGYMAGLVGSSNNPISGVTIATLLFASLLLLLLMGPGAEGGPEAAIFIGAVVCCAAAIAGDNMQDLKTGYLVGATPWKQQVMQGLGAITAALVMAPVLMLLLKAYGFGDATPEHPEPLIAVQSTLMASVARGVFQGDLPWNFVAMGAVIGVAIIALDEYQKARGASFRFPVLAVAVGIYLPFELSVPILVGGLIKLTVLRRLSLRGTAKQAIEAAANRGLLLASGLITGEALVGILMAIPIVIAKDADVLALIDSPIGAIPAVICLLAILLWFLADGLRKADA
jgi:putative OPT family oligopeptide transporter